ncbi:MAG: tRNA dihydrouridine synthase DusB [Deltaproteobacteria bacterium HGW-Deltaproteobacteria-2]|jgi:tRNA-dihydrouridine synthase|nr:MAG: tRNA dihydrouridine synthase DusB [Deltaproteobacteria bacterium HGW-Deltaproteobacteria-2]
MIYLAPVQGITDRIYRNLFPVYFKGVDIAIAPFISASKKMKSMNNLLREFYPGQNTGIPTIPQIMSSQPDDFILLANALYDIGYGTVNWNIGCPFPMVVKKGRGAGMLCYPDRIASFLEKTMPAIKPKLSIKLRIGLKYPDEVLQLIPIFNQYPLDELIIHPRTALQMYEGNVDFDIFEQCLNLSKHRVVYNGDIDSLEKLEMLEKRFGSIERWMIGRGLIANPFLAEKIKFNTEKPYDEKIKIMRAFHDNLFDEYLKILSGPSHITNKMKEIWTYMGDFFENGKKIKKRIWKTHHRDNYIDVVNKIFNEAQVLEAKCIET